MLLYSSFKVNCIIGSCVFRLPFENIFKSFTEVQVRRVWQPCKHSNTMAIEPAFGTYDKASRKFCCKMKSFKQNVSGRWLTVVFRKRNRAIPEGDMPPQIITWRLQTGLQSTWLLCLSNHSPDSGILISTWNENFDLIWKRSLDHRTKV